MDIEAQNMIRNNDTVFMRSGRVGTVLMRRSIHNQCLVQPHDGSETVVVWTDELVKDMWR
ncbi:Uncharacterised protein [Mycobacteroides abscessus subsp. abscessus]|nr:Uncharacterised protein [Mycobacteroides abscessus subsp. abscessus]SHZ93331.1 Uncharacterised protein [Mycobacteroides abscessus subsp. abscessus]SIE08068.1 Uncharacterised protein [Mycobacteroides abscessus subsp. abscessus]SIE64587.1 Uncharacterised protein [Mycobacteroides abscessus subsp. abscessus]SIF74212.1 Uncharacterised protein [Mycobacteroides abscessus subsp. abscessus]